MRTKTKRHARASHVAECLEQRIAPATVVFQGNLPGGTYDWHSGASWIGGNVPQAGDDVIIDAANRSMVVTISSPVSVNSITMAADETLSLSSSFTSAAISTFGNVGIGGNGTLTVNGAGSQLVGTLALDSEANVGGNGLTVTSDGIVSINSGSPNIVGKLSIAGTALHGNAYLDFTSSAAEVRILNGGEYRTQTGGYSVRAIAAGPVGFVVDPGGELRNAAGTVFVDVPVAMNGSTLAVDAGQFYLRANSTLTNATVSAAAGAQLSLGNGGRTATVNGTLTGTGSGIVAFESGGTLAGGTNAVLNFVPNLLSIGGEDNLTGTLTVPAGAELSFTNSSPNIYGKLVVGGTVTQGNSYVDFFDANAEIQILNGGVYDAQTGGYAMRTLSGSPAGLTLESGSEFRNTANTVFIEVPLNVNGGTVSMQAGQMYVRANSTWNSASITSAAGTQLSLSNGGRTATVNGTLTGTGSGVVFMESGGTLTGGTDAALNFVPNLLSIGGENTLTGTFTVPAGAELSFTNGSPNIYGKLVVAGTVTQGNAYVDFFDANAEIRLASGGVYEAQTGGYAMRTLSGSPAGLTLESGSEFRNTTGSVYIEVPLSVNGGTVSMQAGQTYVRANSTWNGASIATATGTQLSLANGGRTATINGTLTGTGSGSVLMESGGTLAGGALAVLNFVPNLLSIGGEDNVTGTLTVPAGAELTFINGSPNVHGKLVVAGTVTHGNAYVDFFNANAEIRLVSGGVYDAQTGGYALRTLSGSPVGIVVDAGASFRSTAGSVSVETRLSNSGTVEAVGGSIGFSVAPVQSQAGTLSGGRWIVGAGRSLSFPGGAITTNAAYVESSGSLIGFQPTTNNGTLILRNGADFSTGSRFTNNGTLSLGPGSILTAAGFTQTALGNVEFQIAGVAATNHGKIVSSAAANLAGVASLDIVAPFAPQGGVGYTLMQYPSKTGDFSRVNGLYLGHDKVYETFTEATSFRVNTTIDAGDLTVTSITNPAAGDAGQNITISYSVQNTGAFAIPSSTWVDSIYLSADSTLDASDLLFKRVEITYALATGATYSRDITAQLPGALPSNYHVFVVADSRGLIPDADRSDNTLQSTTDLALQVPTLTEGVVFTGTIGDGQDFYFRVEMPADKGRKFTFDTGAANAGGISVQLGNVPERFGGIGSSADGDTHQEVLIPGGSAGEFYVRIHGKSAAGAGTSFALLADALDLSVTSSSTKTASNIVFPTSPTITTTVRGLEFSGKTQFALVGSATIPATKVVFIDSTTAYATFDVQGQPLGNYALRATDGAATGSLPNAMELIAAPGGTLDYNISSPTYIRAPFPGVKVTITYKNTGFTDLPAPYFTLIPKNAELLLDGQTGYATGPIGILGVAQDGPAGTIAPGASYTITIPYRAINPTQGGTAGFTLQLLGNDAPPTNWDAIENVLRPQGLTEAQWDPAFANFKAAVGTTAQQFHSTLVDNANYLSQFGKVTYNILPLLSFELQQADNFGELSTRHTLGKLGYSGLGPLGTKSSADALGNVTLTTGTSARGFVKTGDTYRGIGITETGTLTPGPESGTLLLTEADGTKTKFRPDGQIEYFEDALGQRLTAAYSAQGRLLSTTNSATGDSTSFTYITVAAGTFIRTVTDPVGRVTTYSYNNAGDVTSIETPIGTTSFTYGPTPHAPETVTGPNGVVTEYDYDANGRITSRTVGTGADAVVSTFSYDSAGKITVTDANGNTTQIFRNLYGQTGRFIDALGTISTAGYDALGRPVSQTSPDGTNTQVKYSRAGVQSEFQLNDGSKIRVDFDAKNLLTGLTSPNGDATRFGRDAAGNVTSVTQADGSTISYTYDSKGRVETETSSTGVRTTFFYTASGLIDRKEYSTGAFVDYEYDAHRNLLTATDSEGATTFAYNSQDLVTSVTYPNGKTVSFTYDSANRRETVSEGGFTVRYAYDSLGRLDTLRNGANALLIDYDYNELGRLEKETRGNGATTSYDYDDAGRVTNITHRDAANAVIKFFDYAYDSLSRVSSVTSNEGTTTYSYDLAGQLSGAILPGGRTITYSYDADGNRTQVNDNGTITAYSANAADQYSNIGSQTLSYDQAGRLIVTVDGASIEGRNYDVAGRLISLTSGTNTVEYDYDALGNRIGITTNGVRTDFAFDPADLGNVFSETTGGDSRHYANGLGIVGQFGTGGTSYFHYDRIGNTAALTGATANVQNT